MPEKVILKVSGMHCKSCAHLIELELKDRDGVQAVNVDDTTGQASIEYDPAKIDLEALGAGHPRRGVRCPVSVKVDLPLELTASAPDPLNRPVSA